MIIDAAEIEAGTVLQAQVCIVGSGAAGIAMALSLCEAGIEVMLVEAGRMAEDADAQALYVGQVADERLHSPPDKYRQRRFGGSTAIWGGRCVPFDPIDFEPRAYVPASGWPIAYEEVARHYPRATGLSEAGAGEYDADIVFDREATDIIRGFRSDKVKTNSLERFSCPTHFGLRYRQRLSLAKNVKVVLGANCTEVQLAAMGSEVQALTLATLDGRRFTARARHFVLATGGLETPRLLLASRNVHANGVGNAHDVVGRYYMCHIAGNLGHLEVKAPLADVRHGYLLSREGVYCRRRLSLTAEEQCRQGAVNAVARLHFPRIADPSHRNGVLSGLFLARRFISYEYGKRLQDGGPPTLPLYAAHLRNVMSTPLYTTAFLHHWLTKRTLAERKFPSVILRNTSNAFSLEINAEQRPDARSRITLTNERDALGMPRLMVDWRYAKEDIDGVRRTLDVFRQEFERDPRLRFNYDPEQVEEALTRFGAFGGHHIGTTRMGTDPRTSVVDGHCTVHGVHNLHIAGSAVFPTSSQANPTLHLIALALRLGEHLVRHLRSEGFQTRTVSERIEA